MLLWKRWQLSVTAGLNLSSLLSRRCFSARRQHGVRRRNAAACMHWAVWAHAMHLFIALVSWHDADCFTAITTTVVHVHHFGQICFSHSSASLTACIADWTCMQLHFLLHHARTGIHCHRGHSYCCSRCRAYALSQQNSGYIKRVLWISIFLKVNFQGHSDLPVLNKKKSYPSNPLVWNDKQFL